MPRTALAIALPVVLPLALVSACASSSADEERYDVPAGVAAMYETVEAEIADRGGERTVGDWRVGYIVEAAEPWFEVNRGHHGAFREPKAAETHHIEIIPFEAATGRIVPDVPIHVQIIDADGNVVDESDLSFYYATFFHYATNFSLPGTGTYTIRATLSPPSFRRHGDAAAGPALADGVEVEFTDVVIEVG